LNYESIGGVHDPQVNLPARVLTRTGGIEVLAIDRGGTAKQSTAPAAPRPHWK
jgi:hypothetical protein